MTELSSFVQGGFLNNPLFIALIATIVGGLLTLIATWWTLSRGFKNQRKISEEEQDQKLRGAGWALIAEMSGNLANLQMLSQLTHSQAPVAHMLPNLTLDRHIFDVQLALLALRLRMDDLHALAGAYFGVGILFGLLQGKWGHLPYAQSCSIQDVEALDKAKSDFEKAMRTIAKTLLTDAERKAAELE